MINVAIVENEKTHSDLLIQYLKRYENENAVRFQTTVFMDGLDIITGYTAKYDIIFLDIQMKHLDGMKTAEKIRSFDEDVAFIFITSTMQFAVQGYMVDALGYILKPVPYLAFSKTIDKARKILARIQDATYLIINVEGGQLRIDIREIYYLESQRHQIIIHSEKGDYLTPGPLKQIDETLSLKGFARCHNAFLINLKHTIGIRQNTLLLTNGEELPVSRAKRKIFLDSLANYMGGISQ